MISDSATAPARRPPADVPAADALRLLLIAGSDSGDLRRALPVRLPVWRSGAGLREVPVQVVEMAWDKSWEVGAGDLRFDLCVFAARGADAPLFLLGHRLLREDTRGVLFVADRLRQAPAGWKLRPGRDDVVVRPFTTGELTARAERLLLAARAPNRHDIAEAEWIEFLRAAIRSGQRAIEPVFDPSQPGAFSYPTVAAEFGPALDGAIALDHLADLGLLRRRLVNRLRLCAGCASPRLNLRQVCPRCAALDFTVQPILHHFACGHMNSMDAFREAGQLVCPKCHKLLRQIGMDYEKPTASARCNACTFIFSDPRIEAQCLDCEARVDPAQTREQLVHAYDLAQSAEEAVAANQVVGVDLAAMVRNRATGIHARSYFLHEAEREIARFKRYRQPVSLLVVRLNNLAEVRRRSGARAGDYLTAIFSAVCSFLRDLDLTCVWGGDQLAVMLPATPLDGAQVVASRMIERAEQADHVIELGQPDLSIVAVELGDEHEHIAQLVAEAQALLAQSPAPGDDEGSLIEFGEEADDAATR